MQFSLPVVATRWRGVPSVVKHEDTGLLVPIKDSHAFANALSEVIHEPKLRKSLGESGRKRFVDKYSVAGWYSAMEKVFLEVFPG